MIVSRPGANTLVVPRKNTDFGAAGKGRIRANSKRDYLDIALETGGRDAARTRRQDACATCSARFPAMRVRGASLLPVAPGFRHESIFEMH